MPSQSEASRGRYRDVSELSIQFLCEYRLHLKWKLGDRVSEAGLRGARLHQQVPLQTRNAQSAHLALRITIITITTVAALLWVFG